MNATYQLRLLFIGIFALAASAAAQNRHPVPRIQNPPEYPLEMSRAGVTGWVNVEFIIGSGGRVVSTKVLQSSHREFEIPALAAVAKWRFEPGLKAGKPVAARASQVLEFNLESPPVYPTEQLLREEKGHAVIQYSLDRHGKATGVTVVEASHPAFAWAAKVAVMTSDYGNGLPKDTPRQNQYEFLPDGRGDALVSKETRDLLDRLKKEVQIVQFSELDRMPVLKKRSDTRLSVDTPAAQGALIAKIEVFIDSRGNVLLPRIVAATSEEFGYTAVHAVAGWTYEKPEKGGKQVLARGIIEVSLGPR